MIAIKKSFDLEKILEHVKCKMLERQSQKIATCVKLLGPKECGSGNDRKLCQWLSLVRLSMSQANSAQLRAWLVMS